VLLLAEDGSLHGKLLLHVVLDNSSGVCIELRKLEHLLHLGQLRFPIPQRKKRTKILKHEYFFIPFLRHLHDVLATAP
jgi:hypothetical protein